MDAAARARAGDRSAAVRRSTSDSMRATSSRAVASSATRRSSSCAAPFNPASGLRSSCASPFSAADSALGNNCAGSSPGNSSTGWASSHQPPPSRAVRLTSANRGASAPGRPAARGAGARPPRLARHGAGERVPFEFQRRERQTCQALLLPRASGAQAALAPSRARGVAPGHGRTRAGRDREGVRHCTNVVRKSAGGAYADARRSDASISRFSRSRPTDAAATRVSPRK